MQDPVHFSTIIKDLDKWWEKEETVTLNGSVNSIAPTGTLVYSMENCSGLHIGGCYFKHTNIPKTAPYIVPSLQSFVIEAAPGSTVRIRRPKDGVTLPTPIIFMHVSYGEDDCIRFYNTQQFGDTVLFADDDYPLSRTSKEHRRHSWCEFKSQCSGSSVFTRAEQREKERVLSVSLLMV